MHDRLARHGPRGRRYRERAALFDKRVRISYTSLAEGRSGGMADAAVSKTAGGNSLRVRLPPSAPITSYRGAWLSLVERSVRVAEVGGSNPLAPTKLIGPNDED
jgi:hypothetical protein